MPDIKEKISGCFLGGAVGDALGAPVEFLCLDEIREIYGDKGITEYDQAYGRIGAITDDTQMTLFTAEGMIRAHRRYQFKGLCSPVAVIHNAYYRWLCTQGCEPPVNQSDKRLITNGWLLENEFLHEQRAPGNTVMRSLRDSSRSYKTAENNSKGCGGVMRVAPVGLCALNPFELASDAARITHGHPTGYIAAGAFAYIINLLINNTMIRKAIEQTLDYIGEIEAHEETTLAIQNAVLLAKENNPDPEKVESLGQGWVAEESLAIALYCVLTTNDFESGITLSVNHSGDSDSTGSICGNLLGTIYGINAIPKKFLKNLEGADVIKQCSEDYFNCFSSNTDKNRINKQNYPAC